jgi:hypothetical protein
LSVLDQENPGAQADNQKDYSDYGWYFTCLHGATSPDGVEVGVGLDVAVGVAVGVAVKVSNSSDGKAPGVGVKMVIVGIAPSAKKVLPSSLVNVSSSRLGLKGSIISWGTVGEGSVVKAL